MVKNWVDTYQTLVIDNLGILSGIYQYGNFAYISGAWGQGLHNILEPAAFGLPVLYGAKNYSNFQEATDLVELGGAFALSKLRELVSLLQLDAGRPGTNQKNRPYL